MPRKSLVHYIAPSAISITPNCNESANDLAVSLIRGAKIKVFSPAVGLETEDGYFQEWTLYGRNRRLADSAGNDGHRYTIYARLPKANKDGGYLVFAQMTKDEDDEWVDKYWHVTSKGYSRRDDNRLDEDFDPDDPPQTDEDEKKMQKNNWWFRLGEVSEPSGGQRTVTLDTGILGTDQFNTEWNLVQEGLHVDLTCRLVEPYEPIPDLDPDDEEPEPEGEDAGPTPYVPWGYWLFMKAELAGVRDDEVVEVKKWEITRSTGAGSIDWMEEDDPRREQFKKKGRIDLKHTRGEESTDDFEAAVSLVFTVTAWGTKRERTDKDDEEEEQEPVVVVQDGDEGEEGDDGEILAMATITIMSETNEQYALQLSETIVNYDEENGFSPEKVFVHVRSTDQRTAVTDITTEQMTTARLSVEYALANDLDTWIPLTFADSDPTDPDDPDYPNLVARAFIGGGGDDSVFYEGENIIVRLIETLQQDGEDGQTSTVIKELSRKTILNYYNLGTKYVTVGFFKKLFAVHHITTESGQPKDEVIETNNRIDDEDTTVNIEAKRGFWSPSYVSALGQGSGEGGGGAALEWPLQDINAADMPRNPKAGDTIVWDGTTFSWGKSGADMKKLTLYNGSSTLAEYDGKQAVQLDLAQHFVKTQGSSTITGDLLLIRTPGTAIGNTSVLTKQDAEKLFDERYVRVNWFKKVFETYRGTTKYDPNDPDVMAGTVMLDNLKVLVGTWTEHYVSALGTGSDGGSGGVWYLNLLEDVSVGTLTPQDNGKALIYDSTLDKWVKGTAGIDTTELNNLLYAKKLRIKDGNTLLGNEWNARDGGEIDISGLLTNKMWWGRTLNDGVVRGNINDVDNIYINKGKSIFLKDSAGTDHSVLSISQPNTTTGYAGNEMLVGYGLISNGSNYYNLNLYGSTIKHQHGVSAGNPNGYWTIFRDSGHVTINANDNTVSGRDLFLNVGGNTKTNRLYLYIDPSGNTANDVYLEYVSGQSGVHLYGAGFYADTYVSALGVGSTGSGLALNDLLMSLNGTSLSPTSTGYTNAVLVNTNGSWSWKEYGGGTANLKTLTINSGNSLVATYDPAGNPNQSVSLNEGTGIKLTVTSNAIVFDLDTVANLTTGTYRSVTVDSYGRVTAGTNPTTLDGYGITDAKIDDGVITIGSNTIIPLTDAKLKNGYKWWGQSLTTTTVSGVTTTEVKGSMTGVGSITMSGGINMNRGQKVLFKIGTSHSADDYVGALEAFGDYEVLALGYHTTNGIAVDGNTTYTTGSDGKGYSTSIYGKQVSLYYGSNLGLRLNDSGSVSIGTTTFPNDTKLYVNGNIRTGGSNGAFIQIGQLRIVYEQSTNSLKVVSTNTNDETANFYATGAVSALGMGSTGSASTFDEEQMWEALGGTMQNKTIANSHLILGTLTIKGSDNNVFGTWNPKDGVGSITITGTGDYLPLTIPSGGKTVSFTELNSTVTFKNSASDWVAIGFSGRTDYLGFLSISRPSGGIATPYFVTAGSSQPQDSGSQWYRLWHAGNVAAGSNISVSWNSTTNKYEIANSYSLPTASASTKGGVKVGNGLTMNGEALQVDLDATDIPSLSWDKITTGKPKSWWGQSTWDSNGAVMGSLTSVNDITMSGNIKMKQGKYIMVDIPDENDESGYYEVLGVWGGNYKLIQLGYNTSLSRSYATNIYGNSVSLYSKVSGSLTRGFILNTDGNVGIGNSSPNYKLDVSGTGHFTGDVTLDDHLNILNGRYVKFKIGDDYTSALGVWGGSYNLLNLGYYTTIDKSYATNIYGNVLRLYGSASTLGMLIDTSGNVGVGKTPSSSGNYRLDVNGTINCTAIRIGGYTITADTGNVGLRVNNAGLYADTYISALGTGSGSQGGGTPLSEPLQSINEIGPATGTDQIIVYRHGSSSGWGYMTLPTTSSGVTSVKLSVPTCMKVSGSSSQTITSTGEFVLTIDSGYYIPTTGNKDTWNKAGTWVSNYGMIGKTFMLWGQNYWLNGVPQDIGYDSSHRAGLSNVSDISMNGSISGCTSIDDLMYLGNSKVGVGTGASLASSSKYTFKVNGSSSLSKGATFRNIYIECGSDGADGSFGSEINCTRPLFIQYRSGKHVSFCFNGGSALVGSVTEPATFTNGNSNTTPELYVSGHLGVSENVFAKSLELYNATPYIDFHYGSSAADYTTRIIEQEVKTSSNTNDHYYLNVCTSSGKTGLVVSNSSAGVDGDYIKIGGAKIIWDSTNQALHIDKGVYSDTFVSALGTGSSGGTGTDFGFSLTGTTLSVGSNSSLDLGLTFVSRTSNQDIGGNKNFTGTVTIGGNTKYALHAGNARNYAMGLQSYSNDGAVSLSGKDLNNILAAGTYCSEAGFSQSHQPYDGDYRLWHIVNTGTDDNAAQNSAQLVLAPTAGRMFIRSHTSSGFGSWNEFVLTGISQTISGEKTFSSTVNATKIQIATSGGATVLEYGQLYAANATIAIQGTGTQHLSLCAGGGNVGVGLTPQTGYKLYVLGKFGMKVNASDASPFVIDKGVNENYYSIGSNTQTWVVGDWFGSFNPDSDQRDKDFVKNTELSLEDVARAPIINFTWKDKRDTRIHLGTYAQYWEHRLSGAVVTKSNGHLAQDYGATALAAAVMTARTVLTHEERIKKLEQENRQLRAEINKLKLAA